MEILSKIFEFAFFGKKTENKSENLNKHLKLKSTIWPDGHKITWINANI